jgi:hypothetical protein
MTPIKVYLELELWRHNPWQAQAAAIAGLMRGDAIERERLLRCLHPECFDLLRRYLFATITEKLRRQETISEEGIRAEIAGYEPSTYGHSFGPDALATHLYAWDLMMSLRPTPLEIEMTIALLRQLYAARSGKATGDDCVIVITWADVPPGSPDEDYTPPEVDLDRELFVHRRSLVADLVILAGFVHGDPGSREQIAKRVPPDDLALPIESRIYRGVMASIQALGHPDRAYIWRHGLKTATGPIDPKPRRSAQAIWRLIEGWQPNASQLEQAIKLRVDAWASLSDAPGVEWNLDRRLQQPPAPRAAGADGL